MTNQQKAGMPVEELIYHVRIEKVPIDDDEHPMYSFYNVKARDKDEAGKKARHEFAHEFKTDFKKCQVGYVWDAGLCVNLNEIPAI